ncbi:class I SAM-dependent methyltransferase [Acidobacteriota bacterium]
MSIYESISEYYERIFPLKKGRVTFLESLLKKENQKILDIGCATGELALALSSKGHRIIGIDLDENMVNSARAKAKGEGDKSQFYVKDMLNVRKEFPENSFDAVFCLGNTLVHLKNLHEIGVFIKGASSILKKDGIFIIQVVNFERVLTGQISGLPLVQNETFAFERKYHYDKNQHHVIFKTCLFLKKSGESIKSYQLFYPLTFEELKPVLAAAGFSRSRFVENENRAPITKNSPGLICISRKSKCPLKDG